MIGLQDILFFLTTGFGDFFRLAANFLLGLLNLGIAV